MVSEIKTSRVTAQYGLDRQFPAYLRDFREGARERSKDKRLPLGARRHWAAVVVACDQQLTLGGECDE